MHKKLTRLLSLSLLLVLAISCMGCQSSAPDSTPTPTVPRLSPLATPPESEVPKVNTLLSTMYCSVILTEDHSVFDQFETELDLTVTENSEDGNSFDLKLTRSDGFFYDFTHSGNHFTMQHEELGLPYYCAKAYIYQPALDGYAPYDFAVDFEKEYMIYKASTTTMSHYVVASSNPDIDPMEIAEHFDTFFRIYDYSALQEETVTDFYFDLHGTWISEDGQVLEEMDFYITGILPNEYEDGDEVKMELNFIWPESFGYRNEGFRTYTGYVDIFEEHHGHPNFHGTGTLYDPQTNKQISFAYNIFPYDSTVIIYMNGQYLINNPGHDPSQVGSSLNYYKDFIFTTSATN